MAELTGLLGPVQPVLVFLDGDPTMPLARAAAREEAGWLDWHTGKLAGSGLIPEAGGLAAAATYPGRERAVLLTDGRQAGR